MTTCLKSASFSRWKRAISASSRAATASYSPSPPSASSPPPPPPAGLRPSPPPSPPLLQPVALGGERGGGGVVRLGAASRAADRRLALREHPRVVAHRLLERRPLLRRLLAVQARQPVDGQPHLAERARQRSVDIGLALRELREREPEARHRLAQRLVALDVPFGVAVRRRRPRLDRRCVVRHLLARHVLEGGKRRRRVAAEQGGAQGEGLGVGGEQTLLRVRQELGDRRGAGEARLSLYASRSPSVASRKMWKSGARWRAGWAATRCTKRSSCARRSSSHSALTEPETRIVWVCATCLSGSGGTIAPGNFCASCDASQSKSRKRRITLNWPNLNCGSVVRVVTSYV